ncbi:MAG: hypothetical protein Kow0059_10170 [Candidatus Sumerlaeia bacterium]
MRKTGFTLIELLIVVAIIAILAAIAVPNFLEAQVRSKVSRARADMRTVATALESYAVDNQKYPPDCNGGIPSGMCIGTQQLNPLLTTPIAYLSSYTAVYDPFVDHVNAASGKTYRYLNIDFTYKDLLNNASALDDYRQVFGAWKLSSYGPDKVFGPPGTAPYLYNMTMIYDPTNGTVSPGDVIRSQKYGEQKEYVFN